MKRFVSVFTAAALCMTSAAPITLVHAEENIGNISTADETVSDSAIEVFEYIDELSDDTDEIAELTEFSTALSQQTVYESGTEISIQLSDSGIMVGSQTVDGETAVSGVYVANDIICVTDDNEHGYYYTEGSGSDYDLSADEIHTAEEAAANTVVHITQPGTYRISGILSAGQIAVELDDTSTSDQSVELILDNANITCDVAPAVIFYSVYEPYSGETAEEATTAGAIVTIASNSVNNISGSHVGKTFKDETYEKKKYKYDGAFYSKQTMIIQAEEANESTWGTLNITGDNEGLDTELHLTINSGNISVISADDGINVNEDNISTFTINGGYLHVSAGTNGGSEGDGIDSNGEIHINGGTVISYAHNMADGGVDADGGIYINGGIVAAFGGRNDSVSSDSKQSFMQLTFTKSQNGAITIITKDSETPVFSIVPIRDYTDFIFSTPDLSDDTTYYVLSGGTVSGSSLKGELYDTSNIKVSGAVQQQYTSAGASSEGMPGGMGGEVPSGEAPSDMGGEAPSGDRPEMPSGEAPSGDSDSRPEMPSGEAPSDMGGEAPSGEAPSDMGGEAPSGEMPGNTGGNTTVSADGSTDFTLTASTYVFTGVSDAVTKTFDGNVGNTSASTKTTETAAETTTEATTETTTENKAETTESTTSAELEAATESTTTSSGSSSGSGSGSSSSSSGGSSSSSSSSSGSTKRSSGGGGGSSSSVKKTTTTTTEETTEATTETAKTENKTVKDKVSLTIGSKKVKVGSKEFDIPAAPFIQTATSSTLVPLRFAAIAINGGDVAEADASEIVSWDAQTKTVAVKANGKVIEFTAGSNMMNIDGRQVLMDNGAKAEIRDGRMYIPFRALGTALGVNVEWDAETKTASYSVIK